MPAAAPAMAPAIGFTASAHEHVEPAFTVNVTPTTGVQQLAPFDVPASGFARYMWIEVQATGGAGGTLAPDGPWNLFQSISFADVNGANIYGPLDGYATYVANLLGAYAYNPNPAAWPSYVGSAPNPSFYLRIPLEITRKNGLGSLPNQNSAANYRMSFAVNPISVLTTTAWTTIPTYTIRGWFEGWTLPAPVNGRGIPQSTMPPLVGTGQYWSARNQPIGVGQNTTPFTRLGNYIRLLAFIGRDNTGARSDAVFPDPFYFNWDGITIRNQSVRYTKDDVQSKMAFTAALPTGVIALPFNHGGEVASLGDEDSDLWLPTTQSSRMELVGVSAAAGTIQVMTNEVAPVEANQAGRYQDPSATGALVSPNAT